MANVLVFAESRAGDLRKVALEAVTAARKLAEMSGGGDVHAVLAGEAGIAAKAEALAQHGADKVLVLEHAGFAQYNPEALSATLAARLGGGPYRYAVFSATSQGRDLSPRVAAKLGVGLVADLTSFAVEGDTVAGSTRQQRQGDRHAGVHRITRHRVGAPRRRAAGSERETASTESITSAVDPWRHA